MSFKSWSEQKDFIKKRAEFYDDLAEAIDDRAALVEEIKKYRVAAIKKKKTGLAEMFGIWLARLDNGSFTVAISTTMPKTDCMILQAFESSGKLAEGLRFLSDIVNKSSKMKSTMVVAISIPIILAVFIGVMIAMTGLFMVPILEQIYSHEKWPLMGRMLYPISIYMKDYGIVSALAIVGILVGIGYSIPRWTGVNRNKVDNYLPYSIFRDYNGSLFLTSLAALLKGGTSLVDALITIRSMSTPWMSWHISKMLKLLDDKSAQPAKAINTGVIHEDIADRIAAYGERSSFIEAMNKIGMQAMDKTEIKLGKSAKAINTMMMLLAGLCLGVMITGVVLTSMHAEEIIRQSIR